MLFLQYSKIMSYSESISTIFTNIVSFAFEKTLESPLDCKEIKPISLKGNQPWMFMGRTNAEAEAPILWPSDAKSQVTGKDVVAGRDWRQEEKGTTEEEMVGRHHRLHGHEFEQTPADDERQGDLACCSSRDCKESDTPERLNHNRVGRGQFCLVAISCLTLRPSRGL